MRLPVRADLLRGLLLLSWALLLLAGCAESSGGAAPATQTLVPLTPTPTLQVPTVTLTSSPPPALPVLATATEALVTIPAQAQAVLGLVLADLADELAVTPQEIAVRRVESVTWLDAGLGCEMVEASSPDPRPDAPDQVVGYRILLAHDGQEYEYHTDRARLFVMCDQTPQDSVAGEPVVLDPVANSLIDMARRDLAARLDLPQRRVFLAEFAIYDWPDSSLGCPVVDQQYMPTPVAGYRIVLRVGQTRYLYHSDFQRVLFCPAEAEQLPVETVTATATVPAG